MKASELRLGNLVYEHDTTHVVSSLQNLGHLILVNWNENESTSLDWKGIPITEYWLIYFGFNRYAKDNWGNFRYKFPDDRFEIRKQYDDEDLNVLFEGNGLLWIKYIHQLQNLFFVLTGEELTIKEA